jgi:hypothetical protein
MILSSSARLAACCSRTGSRKDTTSSGVISLFVMSYLHFDVSNNRVETTASQRLTRHVRKRKERTR